MENDEKMEIIADIFDMDIEELNVDRELSTLEAWDSVAMLSVIAVAKASGTIVTGAMIREMKTIADVLNVF